MPTWYDNAVNNGLTDSPTIYLPYDMKFIWHRKEFFKITAYLFFRAVKISHFYQEF